MKIQFLPQLSKILNIKLKKSFKEINNILNLSNKMVLLFNKISNSILLKNHLNGKSILTLLPMNLIKSRNKLSLIKSINKSILRENYLFKLLTNFKNIKNLILNLSLKRKQKNLNQLHLPQKNNNKKEPTRRTTRTEKLRK